MWCMMADPFFKPSLYCSNWKREREKIERKKEVKAASARNTPGEKPEEFLRLYTPVALMGQESFCLLPEMDKDAVDGLRAFRSPSHFNAHVSTVFAEDRKPSLL
jgi:hypothetical protein